MDGVQVSQDYRTEPIEGHSLLFITKPTGTNLSTSEGWKAELNLGHPVVLNPRLLDSQFSALTTRSLLHNH